MTASSFILIRTQASEFIGGARFRFRFRYDLVKNGRLKIEEKVRANLSVFEPAQWLYGYEKVIVRMVPRRGK